MFNDNFLVICIAQNITLTIAGVRPGNSQFFCLIPIHLLEHNRWKPSLQGLLFFLIFPNSIAKNDSVKHLVKTDRFALDSAHFLVNFVKA